MYNPNGIPKPITREQKAQKVTPPILKLQNSRGGVESTTPQLVLKDSKPIFNPRDLIDNGGMLLPLSLSSIGLNTDSLHISSSFDKETKTEFLALLLDVNPSEQTMAIPPDDLESNDLNIIQIIDLPRNKLFWVICDNNTFRLYSTIVIQSIYFYKKIDAITPDNHPSKKELDKVIKKKKGRNIEYADAVSISNISGPKSVIKRKKERIARSKSR